MFVVFFFLAFLLCVSLSLLYFIYIYIYNIIERERERERERIFDFLLTGSWAIIGTSEVIEKKE